MNAQLIEITIMNLTYYNSHDESEINLTDYNCAKGHELLKKNNLYKIIWAKEAVSEMIIDGCNFSLKKNQVIFLTPLNIVDIPRENKSILSIVFNREFYCIRDNDEEVSCQGFLFYGSSIPVIITLQSQVKPDFESIYEEFEEEFLFRDSSQGEMLRVILKRLLIKSNRLIKKSIVDPSLSKEKVDLIRRFNILVEKHYKTHHKVVDYAALLFRSPKTLSNIFKKYSHKTPLTTINERILLEARRLLLFSDKSVKEITYELGYDEESHFSKFFKKNNGYTPTTFKKSTHDGKKRNNVQF